jgi:hypothetical protein
MAQTLLTLQLDRPRARFRLLGLVRLVPRVTIVWAILAAAILIWVPRPAGLVHFASTSVSNLADHPIHALGLSAFLLADGWGEWATWALLSVVWIAVEIRLGWARSLVSFVAGHLLATSVVALAEAVAVMNHLVASSVAGVADDVGASYGFLALAGAGLTHAVRRDRRWLAAVPALIAISVIDVTWWTIGGHALAIGVGVALDLLVRDTRSAPALARPTHPSPALPAVPTPALVRG